MLRRRDFPHLSFSLNGGIQDAAEARAAVLYEGPWPTPGYEEGESSIWEAQGCAPNSGGEIAEAGPRPEGGDGSEQRGAKGSERQGTEGSEQGGAESAAAAAELRAECGGGGGADSRHNVSNASGNPAIGGGPTPSGAAAAPRTPPGTRGLIEGVMIGRAAYNNPWGVLGDADVSLFGEASNPCRSRRHVLEQYCEYAGKGERGARLERAGSHAHWGRNALGCKMCAP